jgi:hypothetical protein
VLPAPCAADFFLISVIHGKGNIEDRKKTGTWPTIRWRNVNFGPNAAAGIGESG